jgi:transcriptional regulator with XRE-family HTH domain
VEEMSLGAEIKKRREICEYTQAELALKAGLTPSAICQYESGKRLPDLASFKKIVDAMPWKAETYLSAMEEVEK